MNPTIQFLTTNFPFFIPLNNSNVLLWNYSIALLILEAMAHDEEMNMNSSLQKLFSFLL
jgi:hypothetical protein